MLKKLKNHVLGASKVNDFEIGEIVRWPKWKINKEYVERGFDYGVLLGISESNVDRRPIKVAEILPFGESKSIKISLLLVKKSDLKD